jgi:hypothetical protein
VFVTDWISVVKWARFNGALASPDWATVINIISIVSENFGFTEFTFVTDWTFRTVVGNVFSAFDWLTPFFAATSGSVGADSFDFKFVTRNGFVTAFNNLFNDHAWAVASASSFNTFIFLSTVVFVPEFTGSVFNTALIPTNVAIGWVDTFVALKD